MSGNCRCTYVSHSTVLADRLFRDLTSATGRSDKSVHLCDFPTLHPEYIDKTLEERMQIAQDITSMVLALRRKVNIKVRQPLTALMVPVLDEKQKEEIEAVKDLILNEVNVKELNFVDNTAGILVKRIKPDFKKLGAALWKNHEAISRSYRINGTRRNSTFRN